MFQSRVTGKYYIGSKTECTVIDGKILDNKNGKFYYTSSKSAELKEEFRLGNMNLIVLEENINRDILLEREGYWQKHYNWESNDCYNRCDASELYTFFKKNKAEYKSDIDSVYNIFGQTLNEFTVDESTVSRKDISAIKRGFSDYGNMTYQLLKDFEDLKVYSKVDSKWNLNKYSHRVLNGKCLSDFDKSFDKKELINYLREGASFLKSCELCGIKDYVARKEFGESFHTLLNATNYIAQKEGFESRKEFSTEILKLYLQDHTITEIENKFNYTSNITIRRLLDEAIKERIKISDLG